ncbi:MAG: hypothetical protein FJ260_10370 [Planctomycetes bacterium]|nr:hypothetical protein [Planctomycetota bacterium]
MRQTQNLILALLAPIVAGCAATQPAPQWVQAQRESPAWTASDTAPQARLVDEYVGKSFAAGTEKSALLARSAILATHAAEQSKRVAEFKDDGTEESARSLQDPQARAEGLAEERRALQREWAIWQVQQGVRTVGDDTLIYQPRGPGC